MSTGAALVYFLCLLSSAICSGLLVRSYLRTRTWLLLWSAASFIMLAINNLLVVLDILVFTQVDLSVYRNLTTFIALAFLLYGFIWEDRR